MYYALTFLAVLCSCGHIACNKRYLRFSKGENPVTFACKKMVFLMLGSAFVFCCIARFRLQFSAFAAVMAVAMAVTQLGVNVLAFLAYGSNVSVFSMFQMLGGMLMPFLYGVVWADNTLTPLRIVGIILLTVALILPSVGQRGKGGITKSFVVLCISVFLMMGGSNCVMYIHSNSPLGVDTYSFSATYTMFCALFSAVLLGIILLARKRRTMRGVQFYADTVAPEIPVGQAVPEAAATATASRKRLALMALNIAATVVVSAMNLILQLISAAHLPAVAMYPILTGGSVVLAGVMSRVFFGEKLTVWAWSGIALTMVSTVLFMF